jgi:hypothetical protein
MSVEINAPALIPPPMMKWSSVKSDDFAAVVLVVSTVGTSVAVRVLELDVEVVVPVCPLGELGFPFVAVDPLLSPLPELVDELFVVPVVVVSVVVEFGVVFFLTTACEDAIPTESSTMQITDNIFLIFLR